MTVLSIKKDPIAVPWNFKRLFGWSMWRDLNPGEYQELLEAMTAAPSYCCSPPGYLLDGFPGFTEEDWDRRELKLDTATAENGGMTLKRQPGPTRCFCRVGPRWTVEIVKIGLTEEDRVAPLRVKFCHRATLRHPVRVIRHLFP